VRVCLSYKCLTHEISKANKREHVERQPIYERDCAALNQQAFSLLYTEPRRASRIAHRALRLARRHHEMESEILSVRTIVACRTRQGQYTSALRYALTVSRRRLEHSSRLAQAAYWNALGTVYLCLGVSARSLECFTKVMLLEHEGTPDGHRAAVRSNLAALLSDLGDHRKALTYYQEAVALHERAKTQATDGVRWAIAVNGLASALTKLGRPDEGLRLLKALVDARTHSDQATASAARRKSADRDGTPKP
jgi:tetratricopeptide (TPR) repeat protein